LFDTVIVRGKLIFLSSFFHISHYCSTLMTFLGYFEARLLPTRGFALTIPACGLRHGPLNLEGCGYAGSHRSATT